MACLEVSNSERDDSILSSMIMSLYRAVFVVFGGLFSAYLYRIQGVVSIVSSLQPEFSGWSKGWLTVSTTVTARGSIPETSDILSNCNLSARLVNALKISRWL